jgi:hypothetical protein
MSSKESENLKAQNFKIFLAGSNSLGGKRVREKGGKRVSGTVTPQTGAS